MSKSKLMVSLSNPSQIDYDIERSNTDTLDNIEQLTIHITDLGQTGTTLLSYRPTFASLMCFNPPKTLKIVNGCPPTRLINYKKPLPDNELLNGNPILLGSELLLQELPFNYRPPSDFGIDVPVTDNIYNADPSKPMYKNRYSVSKATGQYKKCLGKNIKSQCNCNERQQISMVQADSDCISKVIKVYFEKPFIPEFVINEYGKIPEELLSIYNNQYLSNQFTDINTSVIIQNTVVSNLLNTSTTLFNTSTSSIVYNNSANNYTASDKANSRQTFFIRNARNLITAP
jgi:cation channel sperm-associated protein subunit beta